MGEAEVLKIQLNGEVFETRAQTLDQLVAEAGFGEQRVATAVNGDFVAASNRGATAIRSGDAVEVLTARQGG